MGNSKLPSKFFKYYSFNSSLNNSRLTGDVYLASPLDFNDPYDCQLDVINNLKDLNKDDEWIALKLEEIGFKDSEIPNVIAGLKCDNKETNIRVHKKQLERAGILCLTSNVDSVTMWAYYANHDGFCVEYDPKSIIRKLVIGFINSMSYKMTECLFSKRNYKENPVERNRGSFDYHKDKINKAKRIFKTIIGIDNNYLQDKSKTEVLNFIQNIYIKRFGQGKIKYPQTIDCSAPTLFFDRERSEIASKYYTKLNVWKHEKEYRLFISLGGRHVVSLGKECIKSITLGYNTSASQAFEVVSILNDFNMDNVSLYKIDRHSSGFQRSELNKDDLIKQYILFKSKVQR